MTVEEEKIHMWALGSPAKHSAGRIKSSSTQSRRRVVVHESLNPASFKHEHSDNVSPTITMGCKSLTIIFRKLIRHCTPTKCAIPQTQYVKMSSGVQDLSHITGRGGSTGDTFKDIYEYFKANTGPMVERNEELFARAHTKMESFVAVLLSLRIRTLNSAV